MFGINFKPQPQVIKVRAEDVLLDLLLKFEKSVNPNKEHDDAKSAAEPKEQLDKLIKEIPSKHFKKMFISFVSHASASLPYSTVEVIKLFLQHHVNTPKQIITEFGWMLPEVLAANIFQEFATACESITKPKLKLIATPVSETKTDDKSDEIHQAVNHGASFSQKWVELKPMTNGKFVQPIQTTTDKKDPASLLSQTEKNKLVHTWFGILEAAKQQNGAAQKIEPWMMLLVFFTTKIGFNDSSDVEHIFRVLQKHPFLPTANYLVELLKQCESLGKTNETRRKIIQSFFQVNAKIKEDPEAIEDIFIALYENQFYGEKYNSEYLYAAIDELIKNASINPTQALMPLITVLKKIISRPKLIHNHYEGFRFALDTAQHLITKYSVNPFAVKTESEKSFFAEILFQWKLYREHDLNAQSSELVPHFHEKNGIINSLYQINITGGNHLETFTNYVFWSELFPLLKDETLFVQHFIDLFGNDINPEEVIAIRNNLIENCNTMKLNKEQADVLQSAVLHKLNEMNVDLDSRNLDVLNTTLRLLNKKTMYFCQDQFDEKKPEDYFNHRTRNHR